MMAARERAARGGHSETVAMRLVPQPAMRQYQADVKTTHHMQYFSTFMWCPSRESTERHSAPQCACGSAAHDSTARHSWIQGVSSPGTTRAAPAAKSDARTDESG
jgi:hypothetical protein